MVVLLLPRECSAGEEVDEWSQKTGNGPANPPAQVIG